MNPLPYRFSDGGRASAGFKGESPDCVVRAIAIASKRGYLEVYNALNESAKRERPRAGRKRSGPRVGFLRATWDRYLIGELGAIWTPTMEIGVGCRVHLREGELPMGRIIARLSRYMVAVIDGVVFDVNDPARGGTRCVYGFYTFPEG